MSYRGFEGINLQKTHSGDESISLIENFRVSADGSLKKRPCLEKLCDMPGNVSRSFHTVLDGEEVYYLLCQNLIIKYTPHDNATKTLLEIPDYSSAYFLEYLGDIYLLTDAGMYKIDSDSAQTAKNYIPLYGKDWPSSRPGEIYEPINLLYDKVAISYNFVSPAHGFLSKGDLIVTNIDAIYRNGELFSPDKYYYDQEFDVITLLEHEDGDEFLAIFSISHTGKALEQRKALLGTSDATTFYELNNHSLLFWGDCANNKVFYSKKISEESRQVSNKYFSNEGTIYIPLDSYFTVDTPSSRVNAIVRHYDRVLIMTDSSTWMTDLQQLGMPEFQLKSINASLGCSIACGAIRIDNSIISISANRVYCWRSNTDELNECNAYSISSPIQELIDNSFFKQCIIKAYPKFGEVWFHNPTSAITWIYNLNRSAWYKYSGFSAYCFLDSEEDIIIAESCSIACFSNLYTNERTDKPTTIFKSGTLEFNSIKYKKMKLVVLRGEFSDGQLTIKLSFDNGKSLSYSFSPPKNHFVLPVRIRSGSFKTVSIELSSNGNGEQVIHGIDLYAK